MERSRQPSVFVAMPFGQKIVRKTRGIDETDLPIELTPPVDVQVNFDRVWKKLIRPALQSAGCRPYRADDEEATGDIRTDMYFELVTGEFVLADISTLNANVFYELGVRHGVSPRGVIMIDGGWCRRPFDVAPDRTFTYKGHLFEAEKDGGEDWAPALQKEIKHLAKRLGAAIANDARTTSSPVYKELNGLIPVNWNHIQNTKARYFGSQFHEWHARVRKSKRQSYVGDILTLSRDAPNRLFEWELRLDAAHALIDLGRFERAKELLQAMENENPECAETRYALAKVLHGLAGKAKDPEEKRKYHAMVESEIEEAIRHGGSDPEALRLLGRIYKYRWRNRWEHEQDLKDRQRLAIEHWQTAEKALSYYQEAQTLDLGLFHAGINVVSLFQMASHLKDPKSNGHDIDADLIGLIKTAARNKIIQFQGAKAGNQDQTDAIWAGAVLGEVALLTGNLDESQTLFQRAATDPDVSVVQLSSIDDQLRMYELLGYQKKVVGELRQSIKTQMEFQKRKRSSTRKEGRTPKDTGRVIAFRGESFAEKHLEQAVSSKVRELLEEHGVGEGDLVICGGRRGAEILFIQECVKRKASVRMLLPVKESQFVNEAVRTPDSDWEQRFYKILESKRCEVVEQHERLGPPPTELDAYERNNDWCLEMARTEFGPDVRPLVLALSVGGRERDAIDRQGSLSHFVACARELSLPVVKIDLHVEKSTGRERGKDATVGFSSGRTLLSIQGTDGKDSIIHLDKPVHIGRAEDNDLILNEPSISRYHLTLEPHEEGASLKNLSSHPATTFLDGEAVPNEAKETMLVNFGQIIQLVDGTKLRVTR